MQSNPYIISTASKPTIIQLQTTLWVQTATKDDPCRDLTKSVLGCCHQHIACCDLAEAEGVGQTTAGAGGFGPWVSTVYTQAKPIKINRMLVYWLLLYPIDA